MGCSGVSVPSFCFLSLGQQPRLGARLIIKGMSRLGHVGIPQALHYCHGRFKQALQQTGLDDLLCRQQASRSPRSHSTAQQQCLQPPKWRFFATNHCSQGSNIFCMPIPLALHWINLSETRPYKSGNNNRRYRHECPGAADQTTLRLKAAGGH